MDSNKSIEYGSGVIVDEQVEEYQYQILTNYNKKYGAVDHKANVVIPYSWQSLEHLENNLFIAGEMEDGKFNYGIITLNNNIVTPFIYSDIAVVEDVILCKVAESGKYIIMNKNCISISNQQWSDIQIDGNIVTLSDDGITYTTKIIGNELSYLSSVYSTQKDGEDYTFRINPSVDDENKSDEIKLLGKMSKRILTETLDNLLLDWDRWGSDKPSCVRYTGDNIDINHVTNNSKIHKISNGEIVAKDGNILFVRYQITYMYMRYEDSDPIEFNYNMMAEIEVNGYKEPSIINLTEIIT